MILHRFKIFKIHYLLNNIHKENQFLQLIIYNKYRRIFKTKIMIKKNIIKRFNKHNLLINFNKIILSKIILKVKKIPISTANKILNLSLMKPKIPLKKKYLAKEHLNLNISET
jgi:hypothetical protein